MDIKWALAKDLADEYHCETLPARCPSCDCPLVRFPGGSNVFCIVDVVKNEYAQQDRKMLDILKYLDRLCNPEPDPRFKTPPKAA